MNKVIEAELCYKLNGFFFEVQNQLGRYFTEKQYAEALEELLKEKKIIYEREKGIPVIFGNRKLEGNKVDFLIENKVLVDVKAKKFITREDFLQMQRYLKAANLKLGLIVNFKSVSVEIKRVINSSAKQ